MTRSLHQTALAYAKWVVLWFALSIGAAMASPIVAPKSMELICSGSGAMKLLVKSANTDGAGDSSAMGMDCSLCASFFAAPASEQRPLIFLSPLASATAPVTAAYIAWVTRAPLPARGPPL